MKSPPLWVWWIPLVWAISFPWVGFAPRPQWSRVHMVPFADPADRPRDVTANIALFVPFGYSYARRGPWWKAILMCRGGIGFSRGDTTLQHAIVFRRRPTSRPASSAPLWGRLAPESL